MTVQPYRSDMRPSLVLEAHDVPAAPGLSVTCRWPDSCAPSGVVVFCHGLGSNGREYEGLSSHWAQHGHLVIHPNFRDAIGIVAREEPAFGLDPDADLSNWTAMPDVRAHMHQILHAPARWVERVDHVRRVIDTLPSIAAATCGRVGAATPCAIAGHSFGAYTAQLLAGAEIDMPDGGIGSFRDERFQAAVLLSAQGRDQQGLRDGSWDAMDAPVLTVTGTLDRGAKGGDWRWKSEPFELAPAGGKYLAVLEDGDHFLGGLTDRGTHRRVPAQKAAVEAITLAFLDAHLADRDAAHHWLASVGHGVGDAPLSFRSK